MSENNNNKPNQLQIELPQDVAQGQYANFAIITHSSSDFIIDFARVLPGVPKSQVVHGEQWALAAEFFVLYQFHGFINTMIFMAKVQKRFDTCNFFRTFAAELKQTTS